MPLYEYRCSACGTTTEVIQSFSDEPLTVCESCGGELKKLLSSPAFQFKGSGWYASDYGKGNSPGQEKPKEGAGEGSKTEGGKSEGAGSDAKPSEKSSEKPSEKSSEKPSEKASSSGSESSAAKDGGKSPG